MKKNENSWLIFYLKEKKSSLFIIICLFFLAHPSSVNLNYTISDGIVRITCEVEGVYPLPEISLFQIEPGEVDGTPIDEVELDYELDDGAYEVELSSDIPAEELESEGLRFFGCTVVLNGTEYEKEVKVPYFPGNCNTE